MANISDIIEQFIISTMGEDSFVDISRNELANFFSCVPSQINYVLETRFTVDKGYIKESHRGGGGYIRITRVPISEDTYVNSLILESIGDELNEKRMSQILTRLKTEKVLSEKECGIVNSALSDSSFQIPFSFKDKVRANSFKNILLYILKDKGEGR